MGVKPRWPMVRNATCEIAGLALIVLGLHQVYEPAALIFAGACLVFVAQDLERDP